MTFLSKNKLERHLYHPFWQSFYMIALVLSITIVISSGLFFVWQRYFVSEDLESILPAENTILLARLDLNPFKTQSHVLRTLLETHPELAPERFLKEFQLLEEENAYNPNLEFKSWMGHKSSFALLKEADQFYPMLFLQYTDSRVLDLFINERLNTIDQEASPSLLLGSQKFYFKVLQNYLALSTSPLTIDMLAEEDIKSLRQDSDWKALQKDLPSGKIFCVFFRPEEYYQFLLNSEPESKLATLIASYFKKIDSAMATLTLADNSANFAISSIPKQYLSAVTKAYSPSLLSYLRKDDIYALDGTDLSYKLVNTTNNLASNKIALGIPWTVFNSLWQNKSGLKIDNDILDFINNEYLYLRSSDEKSQRFVLKISPERQEQLIQNLKQALEAYLPQMNATKITRSLPDGSSYQELVASDKELNLELLKEELAGQEISVLKGKGLDFGIYYLSSDDVLIIAPHLEGLELALTGEPLNLDSVLPKFDAPISELSLLNMPFIISPENSHVLPLSGKINNFLNTLSTVYPDLLTNQSIDSESIKTELILFDRNHV